MSESETNKIEKKSTLWQIYIVRCNDNTLYTGITIDIDKRLEEHNSGKKGAKYTRSRRPVKLVYSEETSSRSKATKRELQIKKMTRIRKLTLVAGQNT
jgi:putative endonuclease